MDYASCRSLPSMFLEVARQRAAQPFLWAKRHREYQSLSWSQAAVSVMRLAHGLAALGVETGDRVALVSENRPEWVVADLAIMAAGAVTVPAYVTNTVEDHRHILGNSGARVAIVSSAALAARLLPAAALVPSVRVVVAMEPYDGWHPRSICAPGTTCWRSAARRATTSLRGSRLCPPTTPPASSTPRAPADYRKGSCRPIATSSAIAAAPTACLRPLASTTRYSSASCRCRMRTSIPPG